MTEGRGVWWARISYLMLAFVLMAVPLLPLDTVPRSYAAPDILLAVTATWAVRRPDTLPAPVVLGVFLLADFLFQRPPGLLAGLVILLTEWLRRRSVRLRKGSFMGEWVTVGAGIAAVSLAHRLVLALVMTPQAPLGLTLIQVILTIALFPVIAGVAHLALGLRRPAQGEVDALGHRL
ncbi:rod shape-determining protein MreD [Rubellimicrobium rubrum]|uniref:Rod shape-determining protein MreD n=1 Tax=Rubellimicrobium rubrum TaxID=2585369 RepID=A0A5C4MY56_9RHOB|nr:rod shape-determining protein MreD [Rubellimicrobium rubrum]TNC49021.1 rod shape-determining protein MreD [Rubellimicrobium rubrum]